MGQTAIGPERSEGRRLEALAGIQGLYPKSKPPAMRVVMIASFDGEPGFEIEGGIQVKQGPFA